METKNEILVNYGMSVINAAQSVYNSICDLTDDAEKNLAVIKTVNVLLECLRSQTVILQGAVDEYQ